MGVQIDALIARRLCALHYPTICLWPSGIVTSGRVVYHYVVKIEEATIVHPVVKTTEKICAYASGKFNPIKSTIDAEMHAVMKTLESLKIYFLDKEEVIIRTDCQAIISFFNKSAQNKPSRVRWMAFVDYITGCGVEV